MDTFNDTTPDDVLNIIKFYDPIKLNNMGVPADEYMTEANAIHARLCDEFDYKTLLIMVYSVFVFYFDPVLAGHIRTYEPIVKDILALKKKKVNARSQPLLKLVVSN